MRKTLFCKTYDLPARDESSAFNPVNTLSDTVRGEIESVISAEDDVKKDVKKTAAYAVLDDSLLEFINNASDAGATQITVEINHLPESQKIEIRIVDNGNGKDLPSKPTPYDWKKIANPSPKAVANEDGSLRAAPGGQHIALSRCAYYLYKSKGSLTLHKDEKTVLSLSSALSPEEPACPMKSVKYQIGVAKDLNIISAILFEILIQNPQLKSPIKKGITYWYDTVSISFFLNATIKNKSQQVARVARHIPNFFMMLSKKVENLIDTQMRMGGVDKVTLGQLTLEEAKLRIKNINRSAYFSHAKKPETTPTQFSTLENEPRNCE